MKTLLDRQHGGKPEVSILLCDDEEIHELNRSFRNMDRPTDVLSFGLDEPSPDGHQLLGDVVVSLETAKRQAVQHGHDLETETVLLALHGTLHLLGHEDGTDAELAVMIDQAERHARDLGYLGGA